jgi:TM2 domain-containing membrane protein YozV
MSTKSQQIPLVSDLENDIHLTTTKKQNYLFTIAKKSRREQIFIGFLIGCAIAFVSVAIHTIMYSGHSINSEQVRSLTFYSNKMLYNSTLLAAPTNNPSISCVDNSACNYDGTCTKDGSCKCNSGYATHEPDDNTQCNYKQKKQLTAFLLQIFLGYYGAGHFYIGRIGLAIGELLLSFGGCFIGCLLVPCFMANAEGATLIAGVINFLTATASFGWWLANTIIFGLNNFKDGNGVPLQSW